MYTLKNKWEHVFKEIKYSTCYARKLNETALVNYLNRYGIVRENKGKAKKILMNRCNNLS